MLQDAFPPNEQTIVATTDNIKIHIKFLKPHCIDAYQFPPNLENGKVRQPRRRGFLIPRLPFRFFAFFAPYFFGCPKI